MKEKIPSSPIGSMPIGQALPPCHLVGWCTVNGLVPHALLIGVYIITHHVLFVNV